jgi:hypothetical protein
MDGVGMSSLAASSHMKLDASAWHGLALASAQLESV